jgi:hypothetical protein
LIARFFVRLDTSTQSDALFIVGEQFIGEDGGAPNQRHQQRSYYLYEFERFQCPYVVSGFWAFAEARSYESRYHFLPTGLAGLFVLWLGLAAKLRETAVLGGALTLVACYEPAVRPILSDFQAARSRF